MQCCYSYSYRNDRYVFGQGDMTCLRSSKIPLIPSETKYPAGKHPNNLTPKQTPLGVGSFLPAASPFGRSRVASMPPLVYLFARFFFPSDTSMSVDMYKPTNQPNCIKFICVFALTFRERCVVAVNAPGNSKGIVNIFLLAPAGAVKISKY